MNNDKSIYDMLEKLNLLINDNEKKDGSFYFDEIKAKVVIDFAITEIEKTLKK